MLKAKIRTIYSELLGKNIKQQLLEQEILQNVISYYFGDDVRLISAPTISEILKGRRNITLDTVYALQETLGLPNVKSVFFPNLGFCELLIIQLTRLILTDGLSSTKQLFKEKEKNIQQNLATLATDLYDFFPDFPEEETSYQIADSLTMWLIEFVALVAQI
ncbi:helix-turn-helix transcriptional regulator [Streptococcus mutans]|uniref:helix-turn-helix transcriptional regulator n=1 Tax=Streptococcus mutans TaxID=1309 RepID=UPI00298953BE|nr:helix-turn-helix transcriptional regulator [Streptococcus mutans]MDW5564887.1 helix-turn-helix transcriptional regulator [Streptococcus mutans]